MMDPDFLTDDVLRATILRECGSFRQQVTLLGMHQHRRDFCVPIPDGGRRPRGVSATRVDMLEEHVVSIMLSPGVLSFTKAMGERLTSGPVITAGSINEFRSVFVYGLKRVSDPSLIIRTFPDGNKCEVYFSCRKVMSEVLTISPDQLERWCHIAYPPEDDQPRVALRTGPGPDYVLITYRRTGRREFGPLHEPVMTNRCTCGKHKPKTDAPSKRKAASDSVKRQKSAHYRGAVGETYADYERARNGLSMAAPGRVTRSGRVFRATNPGSVNLFLHTPFPFVSSLQFFSNCSSYLLILQSYNCTILQFYKFYKFYKFCYFLFFSRRGTRG
jgi:hypothetical protein